MSCKICGSHTLPLVEKKILNKYSVTFHRCENCGFVQPDEPFWLQEAYADAISDMDTGILERNRKFSKVVPLVIKYYFNKSEKFIDYGAGYGVFVRMMRDRGLDFYWTDEYCENIFAKRFDAKQLVHQKFELLTAFEVFEHLADPKAEIAKMCSFSDSILFSTNLISYKKSEIDSNWWYFSEETGQHVALYTQKSLEILAENLGMNFYTNGHNFHLLTKKKINPWFFNGLKLFKNASLLLKNSVNKSEGYTSDRNLYKTDS